MPADEENRCLLCGEDRPEMIESKGKMQECKVCGLQWKLHEDR